MANNLAFKIPSFSQQLADQICYRIASGETLTAILQDDNMPTYPTVWAWLNDRPAFSLAYYRARMEQMRTWADQIIHLADDSEHDWIKVTGKRGESRPDMLNREHIERTKIRIASRQWLMARLNPAEFGENVARGEGSTGGGQAILGGATAKELVGQMVHLLAQFDVFIPPEKVAAILAAIDHAATTGQTLKTLPTPT